MKHIRKFNESLDIFEMQEFCNDNLAYLIDDGFSIEPIFATSYHVPLADAYTTFGIYKEVNGNYNVFNWYDVRDDIIPFMSILSKKYIVFDIKFRYKVSTEDGTWITDSKVLSIISLDRIEDIKIIGVVFNIKNI